MYMDNRFQRRCGCDSGQSLDHIVQEQLGMHRSLTNTILKWVMDLSLKTKSINCLDLCCPLRQPFTTHGIYIEMKLKTQFLAHMWLEATRLDSAGMEHSHHCRRVHWVVLLWMKTQEKISPTFQQANVNQDTGCNERKNGQTALHQI